MVVCCDCDVTIIIAAAAAGVVLIASSTSPVGMTIEILLLLLAMSRIAKSLLLSRETEREIDLFFVFQQEVFLSHSGGRKNISLSCFSVCLTLSFLSSSHLKNIPSPGPFKARRIYLSISFFLVLSLLLFLSLPLSFPRRKAREFFSPLDLAEHTDEDDDAGHLVVRVCIKATRDLSRKFFFKDSRRSVDRCTYEDNPERERKKEELQLDTVLSLSFFLSCFNTLVLLLVLVVLTSSIQEGHLTRKFQSFLPSFLPSSLTRMSFFFFLFTRTDRLSNN